MVGAILTQNTAWSNAALAVARLKQAHLLHPSGILRVPQDRLAGLIRSSGYFNQKAKRLKTFVRYFHERYGGSVRRMKQAPLNRLRQELLSLWGIGPETADSILLYALNKSTFVVDAYTHRILARHGLVPWDASYDEIQTFFEKNLPLRVALFNEYHALLVVLGKELCQTHPKCHLCPLRSIGKLQLETTPAAPAS